MIRLDEHPDFETEATTWARARLMRLALEIPPGSVLEVLRHAEALTEGAPRTTTREGEVVPFPGHS